MKFTYNGSDERVFPTISLVVEAGDTFEAPDDFSAPDVAPNTPKVEKPVTEKESE
jgi:hypothetical protein